MKNPTENTDRSLSQDGKRNQRQTRWAGALCRKGSTLPSCGDLHVRLGQSGLSAALTPEGKERGKSARLRLPGCI